MDTSKAVLVYRARGGKLTLESFDADIMMKGYRTKFADDDEPKTLRTEIEDWEMSNRRSWSDVESESEPDNDSDSESDVKSENGLFVESEDRFESDDDYLADFHFSGETVYASESNASFKLTKKERKELRKFAKKEKRERRKRGKDENYKSIRLTTDKGIIKRIKLFFGRLFDRKSAFLKDWVMVDMIDDYKFHSWD